MAPIPVGLIVVECKPLYADSEEVVHMVHNGVVDASALSLLGL